MADHPHTIDRWDDATGENLMEQIASVGDYLVALATYRAAVQRWPNAKITLRNRDVLVSQAAATGERRSLGAGKARRTPVRPTRRNFHSGRWAPIGRLHVGSSVTRGTGIAEVL